MDFGSWSVPLLWAQAAGGGGTPPNPNALAPLALRRWFGSLTLSSPESVPSWFGVWAWAAGLGLLLLIALVVQRPGPALRQLFDLPGHARLVSAATSRLRRSGRMLAVTVGLTVLSWSGAQTLSYSDPQGKEDLLLLNRSRSLSEIGLEHGVFAALTPMRDVASLSGNLPLLVLATVVLFRASADLLGGGGGGGGFSPPGFGRRAKLSGWATAAWPCLILVILYRLVSLGTGSGDLPLGGCLIVEAVVVPALTALADGVLLAWVLVEIRNAGLDDSGSDAFDVRGAAALLPAAVLAAVAALPSRSLATAVFLASTQMPTGLTSAPAVGSWVRWQLGTGLAEVQAGGLAVAGLAGAVAWTRGSVRESVSGYARLLRSQGGGLLAVFVMAGLAAGSAAGLTYVAVLSLPTATWLLNAADGYAHYATLPVGLWTLAALVELGERALPEATLTGDATSGPGDV